jgi:hypothetical protein
MPEFLVEAIPLVIGTVIGTITFAHRGEGSERWLRLGLGGLALGAFQSWAAGELSGDPAGSALTIAIDSGATIIGWVAAQAVLARRQTAAPVE